MKREMRFFIELDVGYQISDNCLISHAPNGIIIVHENQYLLIPN